MSVLNLEYIRVGKIVGGVFVWPKWSCIDFGNFVFKVFKPLECGHSGFMARALACLELFHCVMFVLHVFFLLSQANQNRVIWLQKHMYVVLIFPFLQ